MMKGPYVLFVFLMLCVVAMTVAGALGHAAAILWIFVAMVAAIAVCGIWACRPGAI